jgi:hypothetical protein
MRLFNRNQFSSNSLPHNKHNSLFKIRNRSNREHANLVEAIVNQEFS